MKKTPKVKPAVFTWDGVIYGSGPGGTFVKKPRQPWRKLPKP